MVSPSDKKFVLIIAGSDPSGGAGVQADLKTVTDCGAQGVSAITAITAQTDEAVVALYPTPADLLTQQLSTACRGRTISAVKVGMVATRTNIRAIAWFLRHLESPPIVIDPILHSSSGVALLEDKATVFYRRELLPMGHLITPNLPEASALAGMQVASVDTMRTAAKNIFEDIIRFCSKRTHPLSVIIKGGHLSGDAIDILYDGENFHQFVAPRIPGKSPRGTGCRFSSAIAAFLAQGESLSVAIEKAKNYLCKYILEARLV